MNKKISSYLPMTETAFYILLTLQKVRYGYGIMQDVEKLTKGRIKLGAGTIYGSLSRMEKDGLIEVVGEENRRKSYIATDLGKSLLQQEIARISELYHNAIQMEGNNNE
ncbi:PadR family transcriptional regulator [Paenibacillus kyungheensis]|uniref:PadR family transcriptional regulator n=1 Tax=Paenibacillus kyungheensis TaxID=1452732 RepID=A0AAX3M229_9BACL|nr:PadR family transcriptional regulator [Paenibacillus kyungheensis]WCT55861.1 PadR family transcriptional regulator [Paenibacillus kyungheensis]